MAETVARWARKESSEFDIWAYMPFFIAAPLGKTKRKLPDVTSTTYMNGLRGIACFIVWNYHEFAHLMSLRGGNWGIPFLTSTHWPVLNMLYSGKGMVCIFFVLSGFVLSYSPLRRISEPNPRYDSLYESLASSAVRRAIRLFGPLFVLVIITSVVITFDETICNSLMKDKKPVMRPILFDQLWLCFGLVWPLFNPFSWDGAGAPLFNHCWTLASEYRGSLAVYFVCFMSARFSTLMRKGLIVFLAFWGLHYHRYELFCFFMGMFVAELRFNPIKFWKDPTPTQSILLSVAAWVLTLFSWLVTCAPDSQPFMHEPYKSLEPLLIWDINHTVLLGSFGAVGLLIGLEHVPVLQRILTITPLRYMGEISFAFYLLHWLSMFEFSDPSYHYLQKAFGWQYQVLFPVVYFINFFPLLIAADYFWRIIDEGCVRLSKKFANWILSPPPKIEVDYISLATTETAMV